MEQEQGLRRQVFGNLTKAGKALLVDGHMTNPDGTKTSAKTSTDTEAKGVTEDGDGKGDAGAAGALSGVWQQWVYSPSPPNPNFTPVA